MTKLEISASELFDYVGISLSLSEDYALIGSYWADIGQIEDQGAVHVFSHANNNFSYSERLNASDGVAYDNFGISVSLSGDFVLIGAHRDDINGSTNQGSAYVFQKLGILWSEQAKLIASDGSSGDFFGWSVSLDNSHALVGSYLSDVSGNADQGAAYLFLRTGATWNQLAKIVATDGAAGDDFGISVSIYGDYALVGARGCTIDSEANQGAAYVFFQSVSVWEQQAKLVALAGAYYDYFGYSVSISGDIVAIGSPLHDSVFLNQGSVSVFHRSGTNWNEISHLTKFDAEGGDYFGIVVTLKNDLLAVGSTVDDFVKSDQGSVTLYSYSSGNWSIMQTLFAPDPVIDDQFGFSTSISDGYILIGAPFVDTNFVQDAGSAYVFYNNSGSWEFACDPGMHVVGISAICQSCELGKYKNWIGDTCLPCSEGKYSSTTGSLACTLCESGKYNDLTGQFACIECLAGKFNSNLESISNSSCMNCPTGKYLPFSGGSALGDCLDCPAGTYGTTMGADIDNDCFSCAELLSGSTSQAGSADMSDCFCAVGFVKPITGISCLKCPDGMICGEGSNITSIVLDGGYWRESSTDLSTRECPCEKACTGSSDISNQCLDGHSGPLCAVCEDGYDSESRFEKCESCFDGSSSAAFWTLIIVMALMILVTIIACVDFKTFRQIASLFFIFLNSPSVRVKLKIFLIYCQIISQFQSILSASYPSNYSRFLSALQIVNLNLSSIFSLKCFNQQYTFHDEMMVSTLLPLFVCLLLIAGYSKSSFFSGDSISRQRSRSDLIEWLLFVLYFFFSSSSRVVFEMFNCDDDFESGSSYLRADYRLSCSGPTYQSYHSYAIIMIFVYPIGIPLLFLSVIFPHRKIIDIDAEEAAQGLAVHLREMKDQEILVAKRLGDVLEDYRSCQHIRMLKIENRRAIIKCTSEITSRMKIEYSQVLPALIPFSSLFGAYKPKLWYFECVECVRRLSLTGLLVFMYPGTEKQIILAMILCMLFIIFYSWTRPFLDPIHNFIIGSAKWGILLQLFGTLLLKQNQFDGGYNIVGDMMVAVGVFFPLLPFFIWRGWIDFLRKLLTKEDGRVGMPSTESLGASMVTYLKVQGIEVENPAATGAKGGL